MNAGRTLIGIVFAAALAAGAAGAAPAQRAPITAPLDQVQEKQAEHNLKIGSYYFSKRKAYAGAKDRLLEIVETYPEFSKIDEVYLILGQCFMKTDEPARAREYFERLLKERPDSSRVKQARELLATLPPDTPPAKDE